MPAVYLGLLFAGVILAAGLTIGLVAGMLGPGALVPVVLLALVLRFVLLARARKR